MSDEEYVANKRPNRVYFSKEFPTHRPSGERMGRYASRIFEAKDRNHFADIEGEVLLRTTEKGRQQVKAFFLVDDRKIRTLTLQRFSVEPLVPREEAHFSLVGEEIQKLLDLALLIRTAKFDREGKARLEEGDLDQISLTKDAAKALLKSNSKLLTELLESEITERDLVAVAYRRAQVKRFESLLKDTTFFETEKRKLGCTKDEDVWQKYFELNPWIFGYGLFYIFTTGFTNAKLEQIVAGTHIGSSGKRTDALLRTLGVISSLCFVEIKTHKTPLLENTPYRPETWVVSKEVVSGVAQVQKTVDSAERTFGRKLEPRRVDGNFTGESAYILRPRSVLVVGSLEQFAAESGVNEPKFTGFELFRRQLVSPEIVTFDELYERARFIAESSVAT